jgi:opacity protein-like surface antigen
MKKPAILSALLILIFSAAFSQESDSLKVKEENKENIKSKEKDEDREIQTLLGHNRPGGGYGAFSFGYSMIDHRQAVLFGGRFAVIASHSIGIGFGGTGFINEFHYEPVSGREVALAGGYGGLYIEPILMP